MEEIIKERFLKEENKKTIMFKIHDINKKKTHEYTYQGNILAYDVVIKEWKEKRNEVIEAEKDLTFTKDSYSYLRKRLRAFKAYDASNTDTRQRTLKLANKFNAL